ncbi:exoglucanase 3, partial [Sistotremastrum suecicum HHB10207 ss-3]
MVFNSLFASLVLALPVFSSAVLPRTTNGNDKNPFLGKSFYANSNYAKEVQQSINAFLKKGDLANAARARTIAETGTFYWLDTTAKVPTISTIVEEGILSEILHLQKTTFQFVVYNLPDRDCSAASSAGELSFANNGLNLYKNYIDQIAAQIHRFPLETFALIIEPDGLPNIVTNADPTTGVPKCIAAASGYKQAVAYAISKLQAPNVALYLDAGHGGWLGWAGNLQPAAELFAEVVGLATKGSKIRGFSINTSNYNTYNASYQETFYNYDPSYTEDLYANNLAPYLKNVSLPAHFVVDTGRDGKYGIRTDGSQWCNVKGAGFGIRPTTTTHDPLIDALVWVKPGGESDGTSNSSSPRFDPTCVDSAAFTPAPEAGTWFEAYFESLLANAVPAIPESW